MSVRTHKGPLRGRLRPGEEGGPVDVHLQSRIYEQELPPPPTYTLNAVTASNSSGYAAVLGQVWTVGSIDAPWAKDWVNRELQTYRTIADAEQKPRTAEALVSKLGDPDLERAFRHAEQTVAKVLAGAATGDAAGNAMRNFLEGLKGRLIETARKKGRRGKEKWPLIPDNLAANGTGNAEYALLVQQGQVHARLWEDLTNLTKVRPEGKDLQVEALWSELQEHTIAVLSAVQLT